MERAIMIRGLRTKVHLNIDGCSLELEVVSFKSNKKVVLHNRALSGCYLLLE